MSEDEVRAATAEPLPTGASRLETGLAAQGSLRWVAADTTLALEEGRRRLDLSPLSAVALGRVITGAALIQRIFLKVPSRVTVEVRGDGSLGQVLGEVDDQGGLRGLISDPHAPAEESGALQLADRIGRGTLRVTRQTGSHRHSSAVELVSGELGDDFTHYLKQSAQIRSAVLLGVLPKPTGIAAAGGLVVEALPGSSEEVVAALEANIHSLEGVSRVLERGGVVGLREDVLCGLEPEPLETLPLAYRCRCGRERIRDKLRLLSEEDLDSAFVKSRQIEAVCSYCGQKYVFQREDLAEESGRAPH